MPSSTSSSDLMKNSSHARAPNGPWGKTLILMAMMFLFAVAGMEVFWRAYGHAPVLNDSASLWSQQRDLIRKNAMRKDTVALVGASRIQLGFNTGVFHEKYPNQPLINLSINGSPPAAVLRDLANDENFNGLVIASVKASQFERGQWDKSQSYVARYHVGYKDSIDQKLNTSINVWMQSRLVLLQHSLGLRNILKTILKRELPDPFYIQILPDRSRLADYSKFKDIAGHRSERIRRMRHVEERIQKEPIQEWFKDLETVNSWVKNIQERGGEVVFIRFPTSGEHWEIDERLYPRTQYWDRIEQATGAHTIHFQDVSGMSDFELPDTSHLDQKDTAAFTNMLLDRLKKDGSLPR